MIILKCSNYPIKNTSGQAATCLYAKSLIKDENRFMLHPLTMNYFLTKKILDKVSKDMVDAVVLLKNLRKIKKSKSFLYVKLIMKSNSKGRKQTISNNLK